MSVLAALFTSLHEAVVVPDLGARYALRRRCVNTSLSGTLFF
jgi:hypothetical protein